jgi:hypothetical protein
VQYTEIDGVRRDVLLARDVEAAGRVGNDFLVDVAVRAADMDMRAGVVSD